MDILEGYFFKFREATRHTLDFEFTGREEVDRGIRLVIGYFIRSLYASNQRGFIHPDILMYASALSPDFAYGALIEARKQGHLPQYNVKIARKLGLRTNHSYVENKDWKSTEIGD